MSCLFMQRFPSPQDRRWGSVSLECLSQPTALEAMEPSRADFFYDSEGFLPLLDTSAAPERRTSKKVKLSAAVALLFLALVTAAALVICAKTIGITDDPISYVRITVHSKEEPRIVEADNGVVASDDERCSVVGRDILRRAGHAIDAAVATALCEGVVNPMASGIGGGAFLLLRLANGTAMAYDMREVAPAAASEDMYASSPSSKNEGALSIGVPGEIAGLHLAWQHHGKLPWNTLFEPAISLARDGFTVSPYLAMEIYDNSKKIMAHDALREFLSPNGTLVRAGDTLYNKKLARTLERVAEEGPSAFYNGSIGASLVAEVQAAGGILTFEDLQDYRVEVREPVVADVMGFTILGMPPPSSGGAALVLILNILSKYANLSTVPDDLYSHRLIEAFKHAYAVRMNLGDPAFVNISSVMNDMLSAEFASKLQKTILDNTTFSPQYYESKWEQLDDHGTSHFGIVDTDRNALAITTTVNWPFGSKLVSESTGIVLNNEMDDFSIPSDAGPGKLPPAKANFVRPKKRPLSSMSPTIVLQNGQLVGVLGASGGAKIITGTAQVFLNNFIRGFDPLAAVTTARLHHQLVPNVVQSENWVLVTGEHVEVPSRIRDALSARGHEVVEKKAYCVTQFILQDLTIPAENAKHQSPNNTVYLGKLIGVSDFRKDGSPAGF